MTTLKAGIAEIADDLNASRQRIGPAELRAWRLDHGLTQRQAAKWIGVSRRLWIRWEMGQRPVSRAVTIIVGLTPLRRPNGETTNRE